MTSARARQIDIARALGVSQSTVSLVLSDTNAELISPEVREQVLATAHQMGYRVRPRGAGAATQLIGLLYNASQYVNASDAYFARYISSLQRQITQAGYRLVLHELHTSAELTDLAASREFAGLIGYALDDALLPHRPVRAPLVLLRTYTEKRIADSVLSHDAAGFYPAVQHLHDLGHRRIALFGMMAAPPLPTPPMLRMRVRSYVLALRQFGHAPHTACTALFPAVERALAENTRCAAEAVERWLALPAPPTAVVCTGDHYALAMLEAARARGLRVPEQLSIIGYDNRADYVQCDPPLTSVDQNLETMAQFACQCLLERMQDVHLPFRHLAVDTRLVVRASTAAPGTHCSTT